MAGVVKGKVVDAETGETLPGASVTFAEGKGISTDVNGMFSLDIPNGKRTLTVRYIGYKTVTKDIQVGDGTQTLDLSLEADNATLGDITVTGEVRHDTEAATMREQQQAHISMTSVSEQHIKRTQDKDASEVIRRIPGVSIIDDKYVMVRGLSQRYNNVWMNGAAVPSSEADQRATTVSWRISTASFWRGIPPAMASASTPGNGIGIVRASTPGTISTSITRRRSGTSPHGAGWFLKTPFLRRSSSPKSTTPCASPGSRTSPFPSGRIGK